MLFLATGGATIIYTSFMCLGPHKRRFLFPWKQRGSLYTVVNHLQVEWLPFVDVVQVLHGDDEAELQDGQT